MEEKLRRAALSKDGYIVSQYRMDNVPYGCRTSDVNGCGWIAAYNFFRALGNGRSVAAVTSALARRSILGGRLGTSPFQLRRYLKKEGYKTRVTLFKKRACAVSIQTRAGILLYRHKGGWHYVAFESAGKNGLLRFFNAAPDAERYLSTMEQFLARENVAALVYMMSLSR